MVKSLFRKSCYINFVALTLFAFFSGFIIYAMVSVHFLNGDLFRSSLTKGESVVFILIFGLLIIFILKILLLHPMNITIDTKNQEIVFAHMFLAVKKTYSFADFDYHIETVEHSIGDHSNAIYLIKNKKLQERIRGYYYSNIAEMHEALKAIPCHGFKKLSRVKVILLYFSRKF